MLFRGIAMKGCNVGKCKRGPRKRPSPDKFPLLPWPVFPKHDFSALQETLNAHISYTGKEKVSILQKPAQREADDFCEHSEEGGREHSAKPHFLGVERVKSTNP